MSTLLQNDSPAAHGPKAKRRLFSLAGVAAATVRGPRRPMTLALTAAAAGLIAATIGLIHPARRELTVVPPGDVALVNGEPILMTDFIAETEQAAGEPFAQTTPAQRAQVLRDMIDEELLVQRALALDLPEQDTDVRTALNDGVGALVNAPVLATAPSDDDLKAYFDAHRANYASQGTMNLTDLVLHVGGFENADQSVTQGLADAQQALYELRSGASQDDVKQHFGFVDSGKMAAGDQPDFAAKIHLGAVLYAKAEALSDGEISEPIVDGDGVHLLVMQHRLAPVFTDFDTVRNNVYADYFSAQKARAKADNLQFLRRAAQIQLAPGESE
jgi:hypothetical protein